jgi:hypothetical protein
MRKRVAGAFAVAILALGAVALELTAAGLYYSERGRLYYLDERAPPKATTYDASGSVFHPYMAYVLRTGREGDGWSANNVGFVNAHEMRRNTPGCCDYPVRTDDVVIGVFGGSVATGLALALQRSPELAQAFATRPEWSNRRVRVLNFAMPGYKQPQQALALTYFVALGQRFDLIVNIDGFNEIVTSHRNWAAGVEPTYPADTIWGEWGRLLEKAGTTGKPTSAASHLESYYRLSVSDWRRRADACRLAACFVGMSLAADLASARAARLAAALQSASEEESLFPTAIKNPDAKSFEIHVDTAERWAAASRVMAGLARERGAAYLHVVQPNQWWRAIAGAYPPIDPAHPHGWVIELVNAGYPRLVERVRGLREAGVDVLDATALFRELDWREVYSDDCCHYTDRGNALFAAAIAAEVARLQRTKVGN